MYFSVHQKPLHHFIASRNTEHSALQTTAVACMHLFLYVEIQDRKSSVIRMDRRTSDMSGPVHAVSRMH